MPNILGVDVGMTGCLAFYDGDELLLFDMPTFARNKTNRLDCHAIYKIISEQRPDHAYVEQVNAFGMGVSSAYNFGFGCGVIEAALSCCAVPFTYVTPQVWQKAMGIQKVRGANGKNKKDKDASRGRATQLFPNESHQWSRKKDDGRAEASLIALYGLKQ